jgi:hypothetical protein
VVHAGNSGHVSGRLCARLWHSVGHFQISSRPRSAVNGSKNTDSEFQKAGATSDIDGSPLCSTSDLKKVSGCDIACIYDPLDNLSASIAPSTAMAPAQIFAVRSWTRLNWSY